VKSRDEDGINLPFDGLKTFGFDILEKEGFWEYAGDASSTMAYFKL